MSFIVKVPNPVVEESEVQAEDEPEACSLGRQNGREAGPWTAS